MKHRPCRSNRGLQEGRDPPLPSWRSVLEESGVSATFDPNLSSRRDEIRQMLGDVDLESPLRSDTEYDALLLLESDWRIAAARMAESLANELAQSPDNVSLTGALGVSWKDRV